MTWETIRDTGRFQTYRFKNGSVARNRVVVPPMASETADEAGFATGRTIEHYARLARSGAGIVMVEYTYVHPSGRSEPHQLGAYVDAQIDGLSRIARVIGDAGALSFLQLTHAGGKTSRELTGGTLQGPSAVRVPVKDRELETPEPMTEQEIALWKESFIAAAGRAKDAGFDGVELHSAHGYGLNQWLSGATNQRNDLYGGASVERRARLLLEIVEAIRALHPELLLSVRVPGLDFVEGGLTLDETKWISTALVERGVDLVHVSSGLGGWRRPGARSGEGYLVAEAREIQSVIGAPVIGVGGIETGAYIDESLRAGRFMFAAVGRAILKDPETWGRANLRVYEPIGFLKTTARSAQPSRS